VTTVEFQAKVENGVIVVPEAYQQEIAEAIAVKVTVLKPTALNPAKTQPAQPDILDKLAQNPIAVPGIRSLTRDQIHER
jgi:hypothetical protein